MQTIWLGVLAWLILLTNPSLLITPVSASPAPAAIDASDSSSLPDNTPPAGFTALFSGKDLSNWKGLVADPPARAKMPPDVRAKAQADADAKMRAHWSAKDGVLVFDGKGDSICTLNDYQDFELYVDWKIEPKGDSGIYVRGSPQIQIWDPAVSNGVGSGGLYNNQKPENPSKPLVLADRPVGEWNTFHIIMKRDRVTVFLNGRLVTDNVVLENYWDRSIPVYGSGAIELQNHGNTLYFKNIYVRELPRDGAPAYAPGAKVPSSDDPRMDWWSDSRFGMFIHWGLYAIPAGVWNGKETNNIGEWIMDTEKIPVSEYEKLAPQFNPVKFDADAWVKLAKNAGMKYIVITTKHHDGFSLFDSKHSTYDIMDATPFKRDIMKKLADACHREGLKICWYHSIMDWHHPDAKGDRFPKYAEVLKNQVKELLTSYGDIGVMWFDGEWIDEWTEPQGKELYALCRAAQQNIIVNNRVGKGRQGMVGMSKSSEYAGDFGTPEQEIPSTGFPGVAWESCMTMNDTWGFKKNDHNWKSTETLIRMLVETSSKGGNLLLNVGPTAEGLIPDPSIERLNAIGAWIKVNGESIYGTTSSPFKRLPWGRATARDGRLYLHVFNWPKDGVLTVPGLTSEVRGAWLLGDASKNLKFSRSGDDLVINVPAAAPDPINTVIALDIAGELKTAVALLKQQPDGRLVLTAYDADVRGSARYEDGDNRGCIGHWMNAADTVHWDAHAATPGTYKVTLEYACDTGSGGSEFDLKIGDTVLHGVTKDTGSWGAKATLSLGEVRIDKTGPVHVSITPTKKPGLAVMNLWNITLVPAK